MTAATAQHATLFLFFYVVAAGSWTFIATTWRDNADRIGRALRGEPQQ